MATLGDALTDNLDRLVSQAQHPRPGEAQYQRADFARLGGTAERYRNLQTGEEVSRRQHAKLIGKPLPTRTRTQARERVARDVRRAGLRVQKFAGIVIQPSGKDRRPQRERQMHDETDIDGTALAAMLDAWASGDASAVGAAFNDAFIDAWWNGGAGDIADVDELRVALGELRQE